MLGGAPFLHCRRGLWSWNLQVGTNQRDQKGGARAAIDPGGSGSAWREDDTGKYHQDVHYSRHDTMSYCWPTSSQHCFKCIVLQTVMMPIAVIHLWTTRFVWLVNCMGPNLPRPPVAIQTNLYSVDNRGGDVGGGGRFPLIFTISIKETKGLLYQTEHVEWKSTEHNTLFKSASS